MWRSAAEGTATTIGLRRSYREIRRIAQECGDYPELLDLHGGAGLLELRLELLGLVALDALLHGLGRLVHERLGLLEAEPRGRAHDLDRLDLLVAGAGQHHVYRGGLLLGGRPVAARSGRRRSRRRDRRRRHAELLLERLDPLRELEHRDALELVDPFLCALCHYWPSSVSEVSEVSSGTSSCSAASASATGSPGASLGSGSAPPTSPCSWICCSWLARPLIIDASPRTSVFSGDATTPTSWPCSWSRPGSRASSSIWSIVSGSPLIVPPLNSSTRFWRRNVAIALAARATSPSGVTKVNAVGPSSSSLSDSAPALSAARSVSVFFTMRKLAPASVRVVRSSLAWGTEIPR